MSSPIRVFRSEAASASFWLENRAPRRTSLSDPTLRIRGRSLETLDVEATLRAVRKALDGIHAEWCGALLLHVGWRIPLRELRSSEWFQKAELPAEWHRLPHGLTRHGMDRRRELFREGLVRTGALDAGTVAAETAVEQRETQTEWHREQEEAGMLVGWKAIAAFLGVSERTAQQYEEAGMPVHRPAGSLVRAFEAELQEWIRGRAA